MKTQHPFLLILFCCNMLLAQQQDSAITKKHTFKSGVSIGAMWLKENENHYWIKNKTSVKSTFLGFKRHDFEKSFSTRRGIEIQGFYNLSYHKLCFSVGYSFRSKISESLRFYNNVVNINESFAAKIEEYYYVNTISFNLGYNFYAMKSTSYFISFGLEKGFSTYRETIFSSPYWYRKIEDGGNDAPDFENVSIGAKIFHKKFTLQIPITIETTIVNSKGLTKSSLVYFYFKTGLIFTLNKI